MLRFYLAVPFNRTPAEPARIQLQADGKFLHHCLMHLEIFQAQVDDQQLSTFAQRVARII